MLKERRYVVLLLCKQHTLIMNIRTKLYYLRHAIRNYSHIYEILTDKEFDNDRAIGELLRNIHSIEKGLSLKTIRPGFGSAKIFEAFNLFEKVVDSQKEIATMFLDALEMYLNYHDNIKYSDDKIVTIKEKYHYYSKKYQNILTRNNNYGGSSTIFKKEYNELELNIIKNLFLDRHSVREFSDETVDMERLAKAIELAHHCPSACNRQGYRVHIIEKKYFSSLNEWYEGMGGFVDQIDKFILITAKLSVYRKEEEMQYIVSSSVFAAYLTLTLQAYGIGCCFVQRPVVYDKVWETISKKFKIPKDEQIVCSLGIGCLKDVYKVPISHRIDTNSIVTVYKCNDGK